MLKTLPIKPTRNDKHLWYTLSKLVELHILMKCELTNLYELDFAVNIRQKNTMRRTFKATIESHSQQLERLLNLDPGIALSDYQSSSLADLLNTDLKICEEILCYLYEEFVIAPIASRKMEFLIATTCELAKLLRANLKLENPDDLSTRTIEISDEPGLQHFFSAGRIEFLKGIQYLHRWVHDDIQEDYSCNELARQFARWDIYRSQETTNALIEYADAISTAVYDAGMNESYLVEEIAVAIREAVPPVLKLLVQTT